MLTPKRIGCFLAAFAIIVGAVCAIGMNFAYNNTFAGLCAVVTAVAAFPTAKRLMNKALEG